MLLFLCKTVNKMCVCIRVAMNVLNFKQVFGIRHVPESYPADIHVKLESLIKKRNSKMALRKRSFNVSPSGYCSPLNKF